ncbi:hypothetical protein Tco_0975854 [Tanacetum coccineum]|uniref:Uncharacterized protein n=1 Tax=Tanacetum coccineum TaxID=301880 RepID=A0ABQ5EFV9_9ASTR
MNLSTSSQPTQQRLRNTPPNSPPHLSTQASQSESSSVGKGKPRGKGRKPRPKKADITHTRWTQSGEKLLAETVGCVENHHKWRGVKAVVPGRRVRTAEDIEEPNELFRGDAIPRPPGKPRPSKIQKSDSSRSAGSASTGGQAFKEMVQEELLIEREKNGFYRYTNFFSRN